MPKTYKFEGKTVTVPDDATMEEVQAYFDGQKTSDPPPAKKDWRDALTELKPHSTEGLDSPNAGTYLKAVGREGATALGNIGAGGLGLILHPVQTAKGVGQFLRDPANTTQQMITSVIDESGDWPKLAPHALENVEGMLGQAAALGGAGKVAETTLKSIPKVLGRTTEMVTQTGPKVTRDLVKETQDANEAEAAKAAEKNAKQDAERKVDLRKHFEKTQAAKKANAEAEAPAARKTALNRGVERLDVGFKEDLGKLREKVNEEANQKYVKLNAALDAEEANPDFLPDALDAAMEKIKGSDTEPTILKDMAKKTQRGEVLTYRDLQGYYSELGRELKKGTLPGDVYYAYDTLQEAIGNEMQNVANRKGLGPQLQDARNTWRQMKQTFYDPNSPLTKALKSTERGKAIGALSGADQAGIEALAKYDPELARRSNTIRGYQAEAKSIPAKPKALKSLPKLEPKPTPVEPTVSKVGPAEIKQAKADSLQQRTGVIRRRGEWIATGAAGYRALSSILHGNLAGVPSDLLEGGLAIGGVEAISRILENPKVVELLTKPTARDLAEVPPELRADMSQIAEIAAKKGIKVDPRLYAATGATQPRKRVAAALTP